MICSSLDENGVPKWKKLLALSIGGEFATRRGIKPEEKCVQCGKTLEEHSAPIYPHTSACSSFFPKRFHLGKLGSPRYIPRQIIPHTFCVQAKRTGGAMCECGHEKNLHICEVESSMTGCDGSSCACPEFKPARFQIIGGMWHREWADEVSKLSIDSRKEAFQREIQLEGFTTLNGWEMWYPAHKIDINQTWRILAKRIS